MTGAITQLPTGPEEMVVTAELPRLSPVTAFDYFTQADLITQWWPPSAEIEPRAGGQYRLAWPSMNWELTGRFQDFRPGQRLSYTWQWTHEPALPTRTVTIDFEPLRSGSRLTVTHGRYGDSAVEQEDRQSHIDGWLHFLGRLQTVGEAGADGT